MDLALANSPLLRGFSPRSIVRALRTRIRRAKSKMRSNELAMVLAGYDIASWHKGRALHGATSTNAVVHTPQGSLVLKKKTGRLGPKSIREHALLGYLADHELPVPRLVKNAQGHICTESFGSHYALTEFVEGLSFAECLRDLGTDEPMIQAAGCSLAKLHLAIDELSSESGFGRLVEQDSPANMGWRFDVIDRLLENGSEAADEEWRFLQSIAEPVRQELLEAQRCYEAAGPSDHIQLVHFDYAPKNLIFARDGSVAGIMDFGNMCVDLRVADLERFIFSFRPSACQPPDERSARIFLTAYGRHQQLAADEIRRIPDFARWRRVRRIVRMMDAAAKARDNTRRNCPLPGRTPVEELWADVCWLKTNANMIADKLVAIRDD